MRYVYLLLLMFISLFFTACSGKKYFEPKKTSSISNSRSYHGKIVDLSHNGATLGSGEYIDKAGIHRVNLGEGYRFINENSAYVLATNVKGILKILDKKSKKPVSQISLGTPVVSASIKNNILAYVLSNNTFGLYNIATKKKMMESPSGVTYAINTKSANPIFIDNLAIMPMLDGKLIISDMYNSNNTKVIYLSSHKAFNNVIYLSRIGDTLIAATSKKIIALGSNGEKTYNANITDIANNNNTIYLFTNEGNIIRLNSGLKVLSQKKFKYAHFSAVTAFKNKVYALDQKGSLIVLSQDLNKVKIYDIGSVDESVFITGSKLYKDGKIIDLSKLGYE